MSRLSILLIIVFAVFVNSLQASEIRLKMKPQDRIVVKEIDCAGMDMKNLNVILIRDTPPGPAYFYSNIGIFYARKDILNRYVFIPIEPCEKPRVQFHGMDFTFNKWTNPAFKAFFAKKTCAELKASSLQFSCGISVNGDRSDYEGVTFTFK